MGRKSRNKGKVGEREWRDILRFEGYEAHRGRQFSGGPDSPDVVCPSLPIHWEVKRVEKLNLEDAVRQAEDDSSESASLPAVAHRRNRTAWCVTMRAVDFFALLRRQ